jgi:hypothetical protein
MTDLFAKLPFRQRGWHTMSDPTFYSSIHTFYGYSRPIGIPFKKGSDLGIVSIVQRFATKHGGTIVVVRANNHYIDGPNAVPQTGMHPDESLSDIDNPHRLRILIPGGATGSLSVKSHKCWIKDGQLFTSCIKLWEMYNVHETDH